MDGYAFAAVTCTADAAPVLVARRKAGARVWEPSRLTAVPAAQPTLVPFGCCQHGLRRARRAAQPLPGLPPHCRQHACTCRGSTQQLSCQ